MQSASHLVVLLALAASAASCAKKSGSTPVAKPPAAAITSSIKYYNHFPFNHVYTLNVQLGGQDVEAVLDTGSSNLLAIGDASRCSNCVNEYGYNSVFNPGSHAKMLDDSWTISFLPIGQASVQAYSDTLSFSGIDVPNYPFGLVTAEKGIPNIWGLSYALHARPVSDPQPPPFDAFIGAANLANQFSMRLCATKSGSNLVLGGFDSALASNMTKVQWTPLVERGQYAIGVKRMYVVGSGSAVSPQWTWAPSEDDSLIVDSGTNPLTIAPATLAPLVKVLSAMATTAGLNLPASFWPTTTTLGGFVTMSDADVAKFPTILLDIANATGDGVFTLTVTPQTYIQTRENGQRFLGIEAGDYNTYLMGTVFMENYVSLFDRGDLLAPQDTVDPKARVGFYPVAGLCK